MKTIRIIFALSLILSLSQSCTNSYTTRKDPEFVDYVNPYMGNISHLLVPTYPTVHLPNSLLRVYPERADYTSQLIRGLPLITTSHRGSSAFNLSPYQGSENGIKPVITYTYDQEKLNPYSYSVYLDQQMTSVDFAVAHQSALYNIDFRNDEPPYLILNSRDGMMQWDGSAISGFQKLENNTRVYIYMKPDAAPGKVRILKDGILQDGDVAEGRNACIVLGFPEKTKEINIRYGISFIDTEQARKNLDREIEGYDMEKLKSEGRRKWNESLGKIKVSGGSYNDMVVFYTSLYRTYERPVLVSEDGRYFSAFDGKVHDDEGIPFYTDDWIWDTYRATHPLRLLIEPELEQNIINSYIRMANQMENKWMPTFPTISGDRRSMNSNHGVATVIDAWRKGVRGFDLENAYNVCVAGIMEKTLAPWSGAPAGKLDEFYKEHGYIPALKEGEKETIPEVHSFEKRQPVAVTLGTAYDQWCLSQIAKELGKTEDYNYFLKSAYNYRNLFNAETDFFHPKDSEGNFIMPFDYRYSGGIGARDYYDENNAYTYRWDVQHNIGDLVDLMGGREEFVRNLDQTFTEPLGKSKYAFYSQLPDQTGNVGQFSMANEPSLHIPYLYNYGGQPWKTQKIIRSLLTYWFRNDLMGVPGDEDGGGTSAFVVFSQLGFYPVTPGMPSYNIGSPVFEEAVINLGNGKTFTIKAKNCSSDNKYIQSASLNGQDLNKPWFSHDELKSSASFELVMGDRANMQWGSTADAVPPSAERLP